jgi:hypothetical protein
MTYETLAVAASELLPRTRTFESEVLFQQPGYRRYYRGDLTNEKEAI